DRRHPDRPEHGNHCAVAADQLPGPGAARLCRPHRRGLRPHSASDRGHPMIVLLTVLSCLAALALLGVVAVYLVRIIRALEGIGGPPTSYLAKIRFGLRAIETETGHLRPQAAALTEGLRALATGLRAVEGDLAATLDNLKGGGA